MSYNVAVIGATGNVGRKVVNFLAERNFPVNQIGVFASERSSGKKISFGNVDLTIESIANFDPSDYELFFFAAGSDVSKQYAHKAAKYGVVIDKSSYFRGEEGIPLVVPEVNSHQLESFKQNNIIACPNCVAIPVAVVLKALSARAKIKNVVITSIQSVSGAGKAAMDELYNQTKAKFMNDNMPPKAFAKTIAFNVLPMIGSLEENDYSAEENKVVNELHKMLGDDFTVDVTCIRAPVFVGHSQSVRIEFEDELSASEAKQIIRKAEAISLLDDPSASEYATPLEIAGLEDIYVSRVRNHPNSKKILNLWIVSDNLNKGAALNAVQIAEMLVEKYL